MEELSASFNAQDQAPDLHAQYRQCAPCFFVENSHPCRPELLRLHTKQDVSHLSLQQVSQVSVQELFNHSMTSPTRVFCGSSFMCVVCGFHLLVKVWIAFIVLDLGVLGLLR